MEQSSTTNPSTPNSTGEGKEGSAPSKRPRPPTVHIDITGMRFGLLRVVEYVGMERNPAGRPLHYYRCICDCGNEYTATSRNLRHGDLVSCGCYRKRRQSGSKSGVAPPHKNVGEAMGDLTNAYYGQRLIKSDDVRSTVASRFNVIGYRTYAMGTLYEEGAGLPPKDAVPAIEDDTPAKDSNEAAN